MPKARTIEDMSAPNWTDFLAQGAIGPGDVQPAMRGIAGAIGSGLKSLATLPERATRAAGELQRTGDMYDPGPALETAMLGPMASFPMALRGKMDPNLLAALYLKRFEGNTGEPLMHGFGLLDQTGKSVGHMRTSVYKYPDVYVENIRTNQRTPLDVYNLARQTNMASQAIGPRDIRSLMMGLRNEYPTAETVSGYRISGARAAPGSDAVERMLNPETGSNARMRIPQFTPEQMQAYMADAPPVVRGQGPRPRPQNMSEAESARIAQLQAERAAEQQPGYWSLENMMARARARDPTSMQSQQFREQAAAIQAARSRPDPAAEAALAAIMRALRTD